MKLVSVNEDPNVKMKQSEKNDKKLCQRCHNINVVALTLYQRVCQREKHVRHQILDLCLRLWFRVQVPRVSHQTSLLGSVSRQVPTLLSCQDNPENVQEVSWQLKMLTSLIPSWWRLTSMTPLQRSETSTVPSLRSWISFWVFTVSQRSACY